MKGKVVYEVAINAIPIIPITLAMDTVFSPSRVPLNIRKAPSNDNKSPIKNWIVALFLWILPLSLLEDPFGLANATNNANPTKRAPMIISTIGKFAI